MRNINQFGSISVAIAKLIEQFDKFQNSTICNTNSNCESKTKKLPKQPRKQ